MSKHDNSAKSHESGKGGSVPSGVTVTSSGQVVWSVRDMLTSDSRRNAASILQKRSSVHTRDSGGRLSPHGNRAKK